MTLCLSNSLFSCPSIDSGAKALQILEIWRQKGSQKTLDLVDGYSSPCCIIIGTDIKWREELQSMTYEGTPSVVTDSEPLTAFVTLPTRYLCAESPTATRRSTEGDLPVRIDDSSLARYRDSVQPILKLVPEIVPDFHGVSDHHSCQ